MSDEKEKKFDPKAGVPPVIKSVPGEKDDDDENEENSDQKDASPENELNEEK